MLFRRTRRALGQRIAQRLRELGAGLRRRDDVVDDAVGRGAIRRRELRAVFFRVNGGAGAGRFLADAFGLFFGLAFRERVGLRLFAGGGDVFLEDDVRRSRGAHHGDFRRRPREHGVRAERFRTHGDVGAAVGFAEHERDFRHGRSGIRVQHFRAVADDAAALLRLAGQEAGNVHERDQRDVERVAETDEARAFVGRVDVEHARLHRRLIGDDPADDALQTREADDRVFREIRHHFEERVFVEEPRDDLLHVDRELRIFGNEVRHARVFLHRDDRRRLVRRIHHVVRGQIAEQTADDLERVRVVFRHEMNVPADGRVRRGAADFIHRAMFARDGLDDFRPRDEHLRVGLLHDDEVRQRRRIRRAARARSRDDGNLRHDAGRLHVAVENVAEALQRHFAFGNARSSGVVDADDRHAHLQRVFLHAADFLRVLVPERTALHGEILRVNRDGAPVHVPDAGDHAVARQVFSLHAEILTMMLDVHPEFHERTRLDKPRDAVARRHQPFLAAGVELFLSAAGDGFLAERFQIFNQFFLHMNDLVCSDNKTFSQCYPPRFFFESKKKVFSAGTRSRMRGSAAFLRKRAHGNAKQRALLRGNQQRVFVGERDALDLPEILRRRHAPEARGSVREEARLVDFPESVRLGKLENPHAVIRQHGEAAARRRKRRVRHHAARVEARHGNGGLIRLDRGIDAPKHRFRVRPVLREKVNLPVQREARLAVVIAGTRGKFVLRRIIKRHLPAVRRDDVRRRRRLGNDVKAEVAPIAQVVPDVADHEVSLIVEREAFPVDVARPRDADALVVPARRGRHDDFARLAQRENGGRAAAVRKRPIRVRVPRAFFQRRAFLDFLHVEMRARRQRERL